MTRDDAFSLLKKLGSEVHLHSRFLYPNGDVLGRSYIPAVRVFDTIRNSCDPAITQEEFDKFFDGDDHAA